MSRVNLAFATALVDGLVGSGLRHACISPGSRSGPLAIAFARNQRIRTWVHVDERSGSFFALGAQYVLGRLIGFVLAVALGAVTFYAVYMLLPAACRP